MDTGHTPQDRSLDEDDVVRDLELDQPEEADEPVEALVEQAEGELRDLLAQAGARIHVDVIAGWTPEDRDAASGWARAQIAAHEVDKPGHQTSVRWPNHVSAAHYDAAAADTSQVEPEPMTSAAISGDEWIVTEVRCAKCTTKASWKGPLTDDMFVETFTRGRGPDGLPNCPHCGTEMQPVARLTAEDAITQAAQQLDAENAGNAARPPYQPSIPGILPAFDWRRAQLTTESLEETCASTERTWEALKEDTAAAKKKFDKAVEALREHIQATHRRRLPGMRCAHATVG